MLCVVGLSLYSGGKNKCFAAAETKGIVNTDGLPEVGGQVKQGDPLYAITDSISEDGKHEGAQSNFCAGEFCCSQALSSACLQLRRRFASFFFFVLHRPFPTMAMDDGKVEIVHLTVVFWLLFLFPLSMI